MEAHEYYKKETGKLYYKEAALELELTDDYINWLERNVVKLFATPAGVGRSEQLPNECKVKYTCDLCGRNTFDTPSPHKCKGGFRKRGLSWSLNGCGEKCYKRDSLGYSTAPQHDAKLPVSRSFFTNRYRVVSDYFSGYTAQVKFWWMPLFWFEIWKKGFFSNTWTSLEDAINFIHNGSNNHEREIYWVS